MHRGVAEQLYPGPWSCVITSLSLSFSLSLLSVVVPQFHCNYSAMENALCIYSAIENVSARLHICSYAGAMCAWSSCACVTCVREVRNKKKMCDVYACASVFTRSSWSPSSQVTTNVTPPLPPPPAPAPAAGSPPRSPPPVAASCPPPLPITISAPAPAPEPPESSPAPPSSLRLPRRPALFPRLPGTYSQKSAPKYI